MKDWILLGAMAGFIGTLADEIVHWTAVLSGIVQSTTGHYISQLIFPHQPVTMPLLLMGEFTHLLAGAVLGLAVILIFKASGFDYAIIKGAGFGAAMWIVHVLIIPNLVAPRPYIYRTYNEAVVDMISHLVWGAIAAFVIKHYSKSETEKKELTSPHSSTDRTHSGTKVILISHLVWGTVSAILLKHYLKTRKSGKGDK